MLRQDSGEQAGLQPREPPSRGGWPIPGTPCPKREAAPSWGAESWNPSPKREAAPSWGPQSEKEASSVVLGNPI